MYWVRFGNFNDILVIFKNKFWKESWKSEVRSQKPEVRSRKSEVGRKRGRGKDLRKSTRSAGKRKFEVWRPHDRTAKKRDHNTCSLFSQGFSNRSDPQFIISHATSVPFGSSIEIDSALSNHWFDNLFVKFDTQSGGIERNIGKAFCNQGL